MTKDKKENKTKVVTANHSYRWPLVSVLIFTLLVFIPALDADFVNWDDESYIEENRTIQALDLEHIQEMFDPMRSLIGNYHPLTELSFAINFAIFKLDPIGYIGTNILIHLLNTILVFFFFYRFSAKDVVIATVTSLLFAIHPMHVESVCWISERKDVLYVFFYLLAMITYLSFLELGQKKYYLLTLFLFIFSLLSKAQAVTLPLVLLLLHFWHQKSSFKTLLINLGPIFIGSFLFGLLAIKAQNEALTMIQLGLMDRLIVSNLGLFIYVLKSVLPINLSALHPYPEGLDWPGYYYLLPIFGLLFFWLLGSKFSQKPGRIFWTQFFHFNYISGIANTTGRHEHACRALYLFALSGIIFSHGIWI
ncbi:MAG: hypothetical protein IPL46_22185 [Saprospiraceae bacterium]|nr:hypothetical protein [Saprospiraceae bacterium]